MPLLLMEAAFEFDWAPVRLAYVRGEYAECRSMLAHAPRPDADIWLARLDGRCGNKGASLERLLTLVTSDERLGAERDVWIASAYASTAEYRMAHRLLDRATQVLRAPEESFYRAVHVRAIAFYLEGEYDAASAPVETLIGSPDPMDRAQGYALRSWLFAKRDLDLRAQLRDLTASLEIYEGIEEPDQYTFVRTLNALAMLCREMATDGVMDRVRRGAPRVRANEATAFPLFQMTRLLGWFDALQGNEIAALRHWREAQTLAPTEFWQVFPIVDRAYLADGMGRKATARELLAQADQRARDLPWSETQDEERLILLTIAQLFVASDPARAQRYLAMFRSLKTQADARMGFVNDPRAKALELYPHGAALLQLGERDHGIMMLEHACEIFAAFEYGWRAALCARKLFEATGDGMWLRRAREHIAPWPRSWIARDIADAR